MTMDAVPSFEDYLATLGRLSSHVNPITTTPEAQRIRRAAASLARIDDISAASLASWLEANSRDADVLALTVGLTREKLKNNLRDHFGTSGITTLARAKPAELVAWLDTQFDLIRSLTVQSHRTYDFGDVLVARAGTRVTATTAGASGRANVRLPTQFVAAVIDGIGWKSRRSDLQRIHNLWTTHQIDGMYTLATLDEFRRDLADFARLRGLVVRDVNSSPGR